MSQHAQSLLLIGNPNVGKSLLFGCLTNRYVPVVATSALRRWNIEKLKREALQPRMATIHAAYPQPIEEAIAAAGLSRGLALSMLAGDETLKPHLDPAKLEAFDAIREHAQSQLPIPLGVAIANARVAAVNALIGTAASAPTRARSGFRDWIGRISIHPVWGVPFL